MVHGFIILSLFFSITEVQRDVEYRVTFNVGNSTVFLNMYETATNFDLIHLCNSLIRMFIWSICNFFKYSLVITPVVCNYNVNNIPYKVSRHPDSPY